MKTLTYESGENYLNWSLKRCGLTWSRKHGLISDEEYWKRVAELLDRYT